MGIKYIRHERKNNSFNIALKGGGSIRIIMQRKLVRGARGTLRKFPLREKKNNLTLFFSFYKSLNGAYNLIRVAYKPQTTAVICSLPFKTSGTVFYY